MAGEIFTQLVGFAGREIILFAGIGFLLLGLSDLAVDLLWIGLKLVRCLGRGERSAVVPAAPGRLAVFVPAWDESAVIAAMLRSTERAFGEQDYVLYVGCYPNDAATIAAAGRAAGPKVRVVVGPWPGPTSKADCLNRLWERMLADEAREGKRFKAVVLHDAEDVVDPGELRLFDAAIERFDLVQLPVLPLIDSRSRWVSASYADEFAEAHGKELVVRAAIGAGLPSAGVGCAISREALAALAERHGDPFDPGSLTEDYELGLRLRALGCRSAFIRLPAGPNAGIVATREYFPATLDAAVIQKARWMTGIAFAGWDRLGWSGGLAERWMRLRDRQAPLAALILGAAYLGFALGAVVAALTLLQTGLLPALSPYGPLAVADSLLLLWRLAMRFGFVAQAYGWREGLRSLPRTVTSNILAIMAARRALRRYLQLRRTGIPVWDKTEHVFPEPLAAE